MTKMNETNPLIHNTLVPVTVTALLTYQYVIAVFLSFAADLLKVAKF